MAESNSAPFLMSTMPETTSSLSMIFPSSRWIALPNWPSRIFGPWETTAMSLTRTGVPFFAVMTVSSMSCDGAHEPDDAHVDLLHARLDEAAAGVHVVVGKLLLHLADGEAVGDELVGVDPHLVLPRGTAEARHVDHVRHGLELLHEHPVLQGLQLHGVVRGVRAPERIEVDLPHRAEVGTDARLETCGEGHHGDALKHPLPVLEIVRVVVEDEDHDRQPGNRHGPEVGEVRDAVHHVFEGDGDLLLHLLGGPAGPLRDDPGVVVGYVGVCLDGKVLELDYPYAEEEDA